MIHWLSLITSLPTENATVRMRAWRALKASGAAVLRDGVYLMPEREACRQILESVGKDVQSGGGVAYVLRIEEPVDTSFAELFDRGEDYSTLLMQVLKLHEILTDKTAADALKQSRKLRKSFDGIVEIDFFPGEAQKQADAALRELETAVNRTLSPDEPHPVVGSIAQFVIGNVQGRTWATRRRPWIDRLACAWLIRRFIDPQARLLWLESPADCPSDAFGFDFDGATFSHVGAKVSFETMLASFGLESPALARLGGIVHFLDVGGIQPPESSGVERVMAGLRETITDDDQLLVLASGVFDGLLAAFEKETHDSTNNNRE